MPAKITKDVLESYLNCKYKGYLKLTGQQGTKSDYETLLTEMRAAVSNSRCVARNVLQSALHWLI